MARCFKQTRQPSRKRSIASPCLQEKPFPRALDVISARDERNRLLTGIDNRGLLGLHQKSSEFRLRFVHRVLHLYNVPTCGQSSHAATLQSVFVLEQRLAAVEERIQAACQRSGRSRNEITLIAVTKVFPAEVIRQAHDVGLRDFGENYVQEFAGKLPAIGSLAGVRYHLIGHLQSNKAAVASELFDVIQTIDSPKLANRLAASGKPLEVMIEVKLSPEESKAGAGAEHLPELVEVVRSLPTLRLTGLMTMPPWSDDPELSRPYFHRLQELASQIGVGCLSMGMSHDFETAIEEGATHIRVGTALFGKRRKP
jgi:PLP dependent protein